MKNRLTFEVNNGQTLVLDQYDDGERVFIWTKGANDFTIGKTHIVQPETMVMLINYYRYIKDNDIQQDWINPNGKNKEA